MDTIQIEGKFSNEEIENRLGATKMRRNKKVVKPPKYQIPKHPGFQIVEDEYGRRFKEVYKEYYTEDSDDLEIELGLCAQYEKWAYAEKADPELRRIAAHYLRFHYKKAISIISPTLAAGWNRWSENILELFLFNIRHKVLWGSGNCGKSQVYAMLLYVHWRIRPDERMTIIATKMLSEAKQRVFGYIKKIHLVAPKSDRFKFNIIDNSKERAIYVQRRDANTGKWINDDMACIISLPVKVNAQQEELGSNLVGKHPKDILTIAFDEAQEMPAKLLSEKIFMNWYTNSRLSVHAWGNPGIVDYNAPEEWDMLFRLGAGDLSLATLRRKEKSAGITGMWKYGDTAVLHLTMLDSPKDDPDEVNAFITRKDGSKEQRLYFLGGKDSLSTILKKVSVNSPSYYSQALGWPYVDNESTGHKGVLSPAIIKPSRVYPLHWLDESNLQYFMSVDPGITGFRDPSAILVGRMGLMRDNRMGIDLMDGDFSEHVKVADGEEYSDTTIEVMYRIADRLKIPLKHIVVDTNGSGDVLRYALQKHIDDGKWAADAERGQMFNIAPVNAGPSLRPLFKSLGNMRPAKDIVTDFNTEVYLAVRCAVVTRQLFNIPDFILKQLYNRKLLRTPNGTRYKLETKEQMHSRGVKSPNDADNCAYLINLMRSFGFTYKWYTGSIYEDKFGDSYIGAKNAALVNNRLGIVGSIVGGNLTPQTTTSNEKRKYFTNSASV